MRRVWARRAVVCGIVLGALSSLYLMVRRPTTSEGAASPHAAALPVPRPAGAWPLGADTAPTVPGAAQSASDTVDVCEIGKVPAGDFPGMPDRKFLEAFLADVEQRWKAALARSPDYRTRAAYLYFVSLGDTPATGGPSRSEAQTALVRLAGDTRDPAVYAMALQVCRRPSSAVADGPCGRVSVADRAAIDSDNAIAWLAVAQDADLAGDTQAVARAIAQAGRAHQLDTYRSSLMVYTQRDIPTDATPAQRDLLLIGVAGWGAAWAHPALGVISRYCAREAGRDRAAYDSCGALATLAEKSGPELIDAALAAAVGGKLGWDAARLGALRDELEGASGVGAQDLDNPWSCAAMRYRGDLLERILSHGERATMREIVASSPYDAAEWARRARARREAMEEKARREAQQAGQ